MNLPDAHKLAISLIDEHKQQGNISPQWRFKFNRGRRMLGLCNYLKKTIGLSKFFVPTASYEQVKDVILHELAHAIVGRGNGHNAKWKAMCIKIGAKPQRCVSAEDAKDIPARYTGTCPNCGTTFKAHRRLKSMDQRLCSKRLCKAAGRFVVWKERGFQHA